MKKYKGAFLNPSIDFLPSFTDKPEFSEEYWSEIGGVLDIFETIIFPFQGKEIKINLHKVGLISALETEIIETFQVEEDNIDSFAYFIFSSFFGLLDYCYLSNNQLRNSLPIESFIYDENKSENRFSRAPASRKFLHAIRYQENHFNRHEKLLNLDSLFDNGWIQKCHKEFLSNIKVRIEEKKKLKLDEEYYSLNANFHRMRSLKLNEGILLIGWTICEYLINKIFTNGVSDVIKQQRREYFNNKDNYPWAFDTKGKQRVYSDIVKKAACDCSIKMDILKKEEKLNCQIEIIEGNVLSLFDTLIALRIQRNNFAHNPSGKESLEMITHDDGTIFTKINLCKRKLLEIISNSNL